MEWEWLNSKEPLVAAAIKKAIPGRAHLNRNLLCQSPQ